MAICDHNDELGAATGALRAVHETRGDAARVQAALDVTSSRVMIVDGEHRVVYANAAVHGLLAALSDDWPAERGGAAAAGAIVGRDFDELHDHESLRRGGLEALERELVVRTMVGAHAFDVIVNPVVADDGERLGTIVEWLYAGPSVTVATVVGARTEEGHEQTRELEKALSRERELNAMQRQFVSMVSHEFRTPLSVIDGAAQLLMRRLDRIGPAEIGKRVSRIRGAVLRMTELIDTTLNAARLTSGKLEINLEAFDPRAVISSCCQRQAEIAQHHTIDTDLHQLPTEAVADPRLVEQVVTNLLSNAVKYSPDSPLITVRGWTEDHEMVVTVGDDGLGIPANELPRIFQRFFRAATSKGISGTGVGLDLVKQFLELQGGSITVDSAEGIGSTFTVRLPIRYQGHRGGASSAAGSDPAVVDQCEAAAGGLGHVLARRSIS